MDLGYEFVRDGQDWGAKRFACRGLSASYERSLARVEAVLQEMLQVYGPTHGSPSILVKTVAVGGTIYSDAQYSHPRHQSSTSRSRPPASRRVDRPGLRSSSRWRRPLLVERVPVAGRGPRGSTAATSGRSLTCHGVARRSVSTCVSASSTAISQPARGGSSPNGCPTSSPRTLGGRRDLSRSSASWPLRWEASLGPGSLSAWG